MRVGSHALSMILLLSLLWLSACSDGKDPPLKFVGEVVISGQITYTSVPASVSGSTSSLDYANSTEKPMRNIRVEAVTGRGVVYGSTTTDANGNYSVVAPATTAISIRAVAELSANGSVNTQVTNGAAIYNTGISFTTQSTNEVVNFNAGSGWSDSESRYATDRAAAPFAILDVIYECQQTLLNAGLVSQFNFLQVVWTPTTDATFFSPSTNVISISGQENVDTDEYDSPVVAHEWCHYFASNFSRDDSLGGGHDLDFILDETVAYSEGLATALAGMLRNDPIYYDTLGSQQASGLSYSLETNNNGNTTTTVTGTFVTPIRVDGWYNEASVFEVLWDIFDGPIDGGDTVALGLNPIVETLLSTAVKDSKYFTSIFVLLTELKNANPASATDIAAIAADENIGTGHNAYEDPSATLGSRYTVVPTDNTTIDKDAAGRDLATHNEIAPTLSSWTQTLPNRLYNWQMFRTDSLAAGTYTITIEPVSGNEGGGTIARLTNLFTQPVTDENGTGQDILSVELDSSQPLVFAVSTETAPGQFTVAIQPTTTKRQHINN